MDNPNYEEVQQWLTKSERDVVVVDDGSCYENLPMDYADASLVVLAEYLSDGRILTTDRRDFSIYR